MDKCRREFEAWYEKHGKAKPFTTVSIKDKMLEAWHASRESMKAIKLPDNVFVNNNVVGSLMSECANQMRESCKDAITLAGYKVE